MGSKEKNQNNDAKKKPANSARNSRSGVNPRMKIQGASGPKNHPTIMALDSVKDLLSLRQNQGTDRHGSDIADELNPVNQNFQDMKDDIKKLDDQESKASNIMRSHEKVQLTRFDKALERAQRGEAGPIKVADLDLEPVVTKAIEDSPLLEYYRRLLQINPDAQPGRPIVNVLGDSDTNLRFQLLTLYELVLAAKALGRDIVQVSLVRLSPEESQALLKNSAGHPRTLDSTSPKEMTLSEIAETNGFFELDIGAIDRDQNIRQQISTDSQEFRNLRESIRSIGLQNPPVVEVRQGGDFGSPKLICISGHRRLMALEALGVKKVMCALKKFQSMTHRTLAGLAENINREDLHFLDKASGYGQLIKLGMTTAQIAVLLDGDVRTIGKYVRAAQWDEAVKARVRRLGSKLTVRFLLNTMAAGERSTAELQGMLDRIEFPLENGGKNRLNSDKTASYQEKYNEFCNFMQLDSDQALLVKKALKYFGLLAN